MAAAHREGDPATAPGRLDPELRAFLGYAYQLKAIADYETGPGPHISTETARDAIETARRFVEIAVALLA